MISLTEKVFQVSFNNQGIGWHRGPAGVCLIVTCSCNRNQLEKNTMYLCIRMQEKVSHAMYKLASDGHKLHVTYKCPRVSCELDLSCFLQIDARAASHLQSSQRHARVARKFLAPRASWSSCMLCTSCGSRGKSPTSLRARHKH